MEIPKVYKALIEVDGRLESVIAGLISFKAFKQLTYKEGQVTYAPEGSMGIFVDTDIDTAKHLLMHNKPFTERGLRVIHEATPLGNLYSKAGSSLFLTSDRYPAILLGKEVWRDKPREEPRPEPKFKVGDNLKGVSSFATGHLFTVGKIIWATEAAGFGGRPRYLYNDNVGGWNYDEDMLELAPLKEEWVDVTTECTLSFLIAQFNKGGQTIMLSHKGNDVARIGLGEPWVVHSKYYKMEVVSPNYLGKMSTFKILEKVVK